MPTSETHSSPSPGHHRFEPALECVTGDMTIAIAMTHVDQLIQYDVERLPLGCEQVRGLGIHDGRIVISIGLGDQPPAWERGRVTGVLLRIETRPGLYAFEVDYIAGFTETRTERATARASDGRASDARPVTSTVRTRDGRMLQWVDVIAIIDSLTRNQVAS